MSAEDKDGDDFCYVCDKDTIWNGEHCEGCHREWGYEHPPIFKPGETCGECAK